MTKATCTTKATCILHRTEVYIHVPYIHVLYPLILASVIVASINGYMVVIEYMCKQVDGKCAM